jgi:hypothetical protein
MNHPQHSSQDRTGPKHGLSHGNRMKKWPVPAICYLYCVIATPSNAATINVALGNRALYPMAGISSDNPFQSSSPGTAAPLAYDGNTWNEPGGASPASNNLLDSTGFATPVGFALTGYKDAVGDHGGTGILQLLGAGVHADGPATTGGYHPEPGTLPSLTISGLNDTWTYTLALISGGNYNNTNFWNIDGTAVFSDPTSPLSFVGGTTLTTQSNTALRYEWILGVNYVVFSDLKSTGGSLVVQNIALNDKFSLNGFQLQVSSTGLSAIPEPSHMLALTALLSAAVGWRRRLH